MTEFERIAIKNITGAFNWIVGGYYNSYMDHDDFEPIDRNDLLNEVYESAMSNRYFPGSEILGAAPKEMRFASKDYCQKFIRNLIMNDEDAQEIVAEFDKYYDPEYDRFVDEEYIKEQYESFKSNYSWFNKSYEQFKSDNFTLYK